MRDVSSSVMRHENRRPAFRSAIARRVMGCFAVAALLPVAAIAILSLDLVTSNEFHSTLLAMAAVAALIAAVLGVTDICRTLRPLDDLREGVRRVGEKDFSVRVDVGRNDEFGDLAASFNSMAARLGGEFTALAYARRHRPRDLVAARSRPGDRNRGHAHARGRSGRLRQHRDRGSQRSRHGPDLHARSAPGWRPRARALRSFREKTRAFCSRTRTGSGSIVRRR